MKLKVLSINICSLKDFMKVTGSAIRGETTLRSQKNLLNFDSIESVKKVLTQNRLDILITISRKKPNSIYQLALSLNREHHHVVKDCRALEFNGFITMDEVDASKKQYLPKLVFEYDLIKILGEMEQYFSISSKANTYIAKII